MREDYMNDSARYMTTLMENLEFRTVGESLRNERNKNDPMSVSYSIKIGNEICYWFREKGILCIEELNRKFIRVITDKGKVGVSIRHRNDDYNYNFGVTMAFTRAIDGDRGMDFKIPFSNDKGRYEIQKPETKSQKKDIYKLIMYWIGDNPLTKDVSDYKLNKSEIPVYEVVYNAKECD